MSTGNDIFLFMDCSILKLIDGWITCHFTSFSMGWSGGAMVLVNFQCRGVLLIWIIVALWPTALEVGREGVFLDIFSSVVFEENVEVLS